jgi:hydroxymethylpyrimidine/phosphomethylpyrimidine kinase
MSIPRALTIAGSDSGGGAGIQADLKTFESRGVFGATAITAVTAQNTVGVRHVFELPPELVAQQIDAVMQDIGADAVKTGMLANAAIVEVVAERLGRYGVRRLVVDPVMVAKSGDALLAAEAGRALLERLLPMALVVTPNLHEAGVLIGRDVTTLADMFAAARAIHAMGPAHVVVKGGHLADDADSVDILFDGQEYREYRAPRIDSKNTHGTGCTFASAIAAELARGADVAHAVASAKEYLTGAIRAADDMGIGAGHGPVNHFWQQRQYRTAGPWSGGAEGGDRAGR